ncbi:MAG: energy-coupling factor transporter transmembrane component T [Lachnospiraceae bacterium]|nr:energy-coupling factor transporter transmembrane component T [Lachnospiraceae bacterium]MEE3460296.1 energy-coupling factor transporter transmembrane component T [Lachnospiraceae bacterium]
MGKINTIGRYYKADSVIHRLDPRAKLAMALIYIISVFFVDSPVAFIVPALVLVIEYKLAKVPLSFALRGLRGMLILFLFTAVLNMFFTPGRVLVSFWKLHITYEGIVLGIKLVLRFLFLVIGSSLLTYTSTPSEIAGSLETLLKPLKVFKIPVHDFATMISIALRFIPLFSDQAQRLKLAQEARGVDFSEGSIFVRMKKLTSLVIPLFVSAITRSNELALAMDARCYNSSEGRTYLHRFAFSFNDYAAIFLMLIYMVLVIIFL